MEINDKTIRTMIAEIKKSSLSEKKQVSTSIAKRVLKNFLSLSAANVITRGLGFVSTAYLARTLGVNGFGKIGFALAVVAYFQLIVNMGLNTFGTREVARHPEKVKRYVSHILAIRLPLSFFAYGLLALFVYFLPKPAEMKQLLLLYGLGLFIFSFTLDWVFQGLERMEFTALGQVLTNLVYTAALFVFVKSPDDVLKVPAFLMLGGLAGFTMLGLIFSKWFGFFRPRMDIGFWKEMLHQSLPMWFSAFMISIYYSFDTIMLGFMKDMNVVGWYNAAYKIILLIIGFQGLVNQSIFPRLSKLWSVKNFTQLEPFIHTVMSFMFLISLILITSCLTFGAPLVRLIYGNEFQNAVFAFMLLSFTAFLVYNESVTAPFLYACNQQSQHLVSVSVGASVNLILNILLIPRFSFYGAAVATIVAEIFVFSFLLYFSLRVVRIDFKIVYLKNLLAFAFALPILFLPRFHLFIKFLVFIAILLGVRLNSFKSNIKSILNLTEDN